MKRTVAAVCLAGAMVVLAGTAWAAIPGAGGTISACYTKIGGVLRVIDAEAGKACTALENPISWNQQGRQGEAGSQGPQGEPGPQGPEGPAGTFSGTFESPNGAYSISVTDDGIVLSGPSASIEIGAASIDIKAAGDVTIKGSKIEQN